MPSPLLEAADEAGPSTTAACVLLAWGRKQQLLRARCKCQRVL